MQLYPYGNSGHQRVNSFIGATLCMAHSTVFAIVRCPLSVRLSVTHWYCVETAEPRMMSFCDRIARGLWLSANLMQKFEQYHQQQNNLHSETVRLMPTC